MKDMKVRNIIHRALLSATALFIASTASFAEESNLVVNWEGNGSADSPYQIKTAKDLAAIAYYTEKGVSFANVYFRMTSDISLSGYSWTPIGNSDSGKAKFMGVFDGGGFTIDDLTITGEDENFHALFGDILDATIQNLTIGTSSSIVGKTRVAAVVAAAGGNCIISNVHNKANVTGYGETIGGIVGMSGGNITLSNCTNSGTIKSLLSNIAQTFIGGIAGFCNNGVVSNCVNEGAVSSYKGYFTGGILGCAGGNDGVVSVEIIGCINNGLVSSESNSVGGIAGSVGHTTNNIIQITISTCTNTNKVSSSDGTYVGGIVGATNSPCVRVQNCTNEGQIVTENTEHSVGGIVGFSNYGLISDCINNGSVTTNGSPSTCYCTGGIVGRIAGMTLFDSYVKNCVNKGEISTQGTYIGGIVGLYDGNPTKEKPHYIHVKLVENCTNMGRITGTGSYSTTGNGNVGGIMGHGPAIVNRCYNEADVTGNHNHVAGIVGALGTIINCYNKGNITSNSSSDYYNDAAGLLGFNWTDALGQDLFIANSYSRGDVKTAGTHAYVGSIAGSGYTTIKNCYGSGNVQFSRDGKTVETKYVVGACYTDKAEKKFAPHAYGKDGVFGGPGDVKDILYNIDAGGFGNYIISNGEPYNYTHGTVLSFLQGHQGGTYKKFDIGDDPLSPVITIETEAWKKSTTDGYPVFEHEPGYVEPIVSTYTVTYNLNATGTPAGISAPAQQSGSQNYTVSDIASEGVYSYVSGNVKYSFAGWNTKADGTGDSYVAGSIITPSENTTLYGMWTVGFQVRYALSSGLSDSDFGSLTLPFDPTWYDVNTEVTVQMPESGDFSPKEFDFWSTEPDGSGDRYGEAYKLENNNKFTITKDMVLYANVHDVTFQKIVIERNGLKSGESAVYTVEGIVEEPEGKRWYVVALEGREESDAPVKVSATIVNVPTGKYIVTETGWNWSYDKADAVVLPESQKVSADKGTATATMDDNRTLIFTFGGSISEEEMPKHGENAKGTK